MHTSAGGLDRLRCDLTDAEGRDGYLARVARYAAEHPDKEWILGSGWYMDAFPGGIPYRTDLDDVAPPAGLGGGAAEVSGSAHARRAAAAKDPGFAAEAPRPLSPAGTRVGI